MIIKMITTTTRVKKQDIRYKRFFLEYLKHLKTESKQVHSDQHNDNDINKNYVCFKETL